MEREVPSGGFSSEDEVNDAVDKLDSLAQTAVAVDLQRARELEQERTLRDIQIRLLNWLTFSSKGHCTDLNTSVKKSVNCNVET